jgi:hypothetical protein
VLQECFDEFDEVPSLGLGLQVKMWTCSVHASETPHFLSPVRWLDSVKLNVC